MVKFLTNDVLAKQKHKHSLCSAGVYIRITNQVLTPIAISVCQVSKSQPLWLYKYIALELMMAIM